MKKNILVIVTILGFAGSVFAAQPALEQLTPSDTPMPITCPLLKPQPKPVICDPAKPQGPDIIEVPCAKEALKFAKAALAAEAVNLGMKGKSNVDAKTRIFDWEGPSILKYNYQGTIGGFYNYNLKVMLNPACELLKPVALKTSPIPVKP